MPGLSLATKGIVAGTTGTLTSGNPPSATVGQGDNQIARTDPVNIDVTYPAGKKRAVIVAWFDGLYEAGRYPRMAELVHDGDQWGPRYAAASALSSQGGVDSFTLRRDGGWIAAPTFWVLAYDLAAQENTSSQDT